MIDAAAYVWIKAIHVASVIAFASGVLAQTLFVVAAKSGITTAAVGRFRAAERLITIPALFAALATGVTIATQGGWFASRWLMIKLVLVALLLAVHGYQSGLLRRMASARPVQTRSMQYVLLAILIAIAVLAVAKPSFS